MSGLVSWVEEGEDLLLGLALEVREMLDGFEEQGRPCPAVRVAGRGPGGEFSCGAGSGAISCSGLEVVELGWSVLASLGVGSVSSWGLLVVEVGLVGALLSALVDVLDGAADLAGEGGEPGFLGFAGLEVLDRGELVGVVSQVVVLDVRC